MGQALSSLWLLLSRKRQDRLGPPLTIWRFAVGALLSGLAVSLLLHYILYRIGLPSTPFIYVNF